MLAMETGDLVVLREPEVGLLPPGEYDMETWDRVSSDGAIDRYLVVTRRS